MMDCPLHLLIVDDSEQDAFLIEKALEEHGFKLTIRRIQTERELLASLASARWDAVIADYSLPQFSGFEALRLVRRDAPNTPFLLVSGTLNEEEAVNAITAGADDYVLKDRLKRLGHALEQAIKSRRLQSERNRLEEEVKVREQRLTAFFTGATAGLALLDSNLRFVQTNGTLDEMLGKRAKEHIGQLVEDVLPSITPPVTPVLRRILETGEPVLDFELSGETPDRPGERRHWIDSLFPIRGADGAPAGVGAIVVEITDRKRQEEALRESERRFREMLENVDLIAITLDRQGVVTFCNDFLLNLTGWKREEVLGKDWCSRFLPESDQSARDVFFQTIDSGQIPSHYENPIVTRMGAHREVVWNNTMLRNADGSVGGVASIGVDVTDRKKAEQVKAALAMRNEAFVRVLGEVVYDHDLVHDRIEWGGDPQKCFGWSIDALGASMNEWMARIHPDDRARVTADLLSPTNQEFFSSEYRHRHKSGHYVWVFDRGLITRDESGKITRLIGIMLDVSARKRADTALRESQERFQQLAENIEEVFWMTDVVKDQILYVSPGYEKIWGRSTESLYKNSQGWIEAIHPEDRDRIDFAARNKQTLGEYDETYRIIRTDGTVRWIHDRAFPIRNASGEVYRVVGVAEDVTQTRRLEDQFRQAQKMEALGTLAGGIAHDFNNILAAMNGYTELAKIGAKDSPAIIENLEAVAAAGARATDLVRQILAFSRRQAQERKLIQLRHIVGEAVKLLRATIPASITFKTSLPFDTHLVLADATQIHQIVMNLVTNAWHAMRERAGVLTVNLENVMVDNRLAQELPNLRPGRYVRLSVSDTGHGMDRSTMDRIFEPFFTTKPAGEGTGLGLSVVHGIMQNHEGAITVESEAGKGTTFRLYFPAHSNDGAEVNTEGSKLTRGTGQRILFLDDEGALAMLGKKALGQYGYEVDAFTNVTDALEAFRANPQGFDLVLTDFAMPGMMGTDFARQVLQIRPGVPVLLMTGYAANFTVERVRAMGIADLLIKPLTIESLVEAVGKALASRSFPD